MVTPYPLHSLGVTMLYLAEISTAPVIEGVALMTALGIIMYMVRKEGKRPRSNPHEGAGLADAFAAALAKHDKERPCSKHGEDIAALKRDVSHMRQQISDLFKTLQQR